MSIKKRINKHRNWAINAMKQNPECRNNDWDLLLTVLSNQGVHLNESQKYAIKNSGVNFHTLLRERQRLQSSGEYLPTDPTILEKRRLAEKEYREFYLQN